MPRTHVHLLQQVPAEPADLLQRFTREQLIAACNVAFDAVECAMEADEVRRAGRGRGFKRGRAVI